MLREVTRDHRLMFETVHCEVVEGRPNPFTKTPMREVMQLGMTDAERAYVQSRLARHVRSVEKHVPRNGEVYTRRAALAFSDGGKCDVFFKGPPTGLELDLVPAATFAVAPRWMNRLLVEMLFDLGRSANLLLVDVAYQQHYVFTEGQQKLRDRLVGAAARGTFRVHTARELAVKLSGWTAGYPVADLGDDWSPPGLLDETEDPGWIVVPFQGAVQPATPTPRAVELWLIPGPLSVRVKVNPFTKKKGKDLVGRRLSRPAMKEVVEYFERRDIVRPRQDDETWFELSDEGTLVFNEVGPGRIILSVVPSPLAAKELLDLMRAGGFVIFVSPPTAVERRLISASPDTVACVPSEMAMHTFCSTPNELLTELRAAIRA